MKYKCKKCDFTFNFDDFDGYFQFYRDVDIHIEHHIREQKRKEYFTEI